MTTEFRQKQPGEKWPISFDFAAKLGAATIASVTSLIALDQLDNSNVSATVLDSTLQTNTTTVVYTYVRAGTTDHRYLITCIIAGSDGSIHELEGILPVLETPDAGTSSGGGLVVAPIIEPITRAELLTHLKLDSGTFDGNLTLTQSLPYISHAVQNNYTVHVGTGVNVLGKQAEVLLHCGTNAATGTNDTKIQESDDNSTWTDWTGGAFTQVTTANDNADFKKAYTGTKQYIRTASKVLVAACEFGTSILVNAATTAEDDDLTDLITEGRQAIENITRRALLTQTWDYSLQEWPDKDFIKLPGGNLQTVSSVKWTDTAGTITILTAGTDYLVETNGEEIGRIVLPYGVSWPSGTLYPSNPITIRYVDGWTTAALVPRNIKRAVRFAAEDAYYHGNRHEVLQGVIMNLLASARLWDEF